MGQERGFSLNATESHESHHSHRPLIAARREQRQALFQAGIVERDTYSSKKEEGTTILDSLIATGVKMTLNPIK